MPGPPWPLKVELDVPEPRVSNGLISLPADGTLWDKSLGSNWWIDPITQTVMPAPLPVTSDWTTTYTGDFARFVKADFTFAHGSDWYEVQRRAAADLYLESHRLEAVSTTATMPVNQPMWISTYIAGVETYSDQTVLMCGWGSEGVGVWLRVRAGGAVTVYKDLEISNHYTLEGGISPTGTSKSTPGALQGKTTDFLLLPCRRRALLVVTSSGAGFEHIFSDLDAAGLTNEITPAAPFWFHVPAGRPCVQVAKVRFRESATIYSVAHTLRYPPPTGYTFNEIYASDRIGPTTATIGQAFSVVKSDTTAYTPDGVIDTARVKAVLTGDGAGVYGLYAVDMWNPGTIVETADQPYDATLRVRSLSLSVGRDGVASGTLSMLNPDGLTTDGLEQAAITGDRPVRISLDDIDLLRGTATPPEREWANGANAGAVDTLTWSLADRTQDLIDAGLPSAYPLDGLVLTSAVQQLLRAAAFDTPYDIDAITFELPYTPGVSRGEWALMPDRGDTVGQWLERLHQDYAATFLRGWRPTATGYLYRFQAPEALGTTPAMELYQSRADATAASVSASLIDYRTIHHYKTARSRPEANQIIVIGQDPHTLAPILSQWNDAGSQNPATAPADRPDNWIGKVLPYSLKDPAIRSQAAADRARDILTERMGWSIEVATWVSELLVQDSDGVPIWIGDVVRVWDEGGVASTDLRIVAIPKMDFIAQDGAAGRGTWRCEYVAEVLVLQLDFSSADNSGYLYFLGGF